MKKNTNSQLIYHIADATFDTLIPNYNILMSNIVTDICPSTSLTTDRFSHAHNRAAYYNAVTKCPYCFETTARFRMRLYLTSYEGMMLCKRCNNVTEYSEYYNSLCLIDAYTVAFLQSGKMILFTLLNKSAIHKFK